MRGLHAGCVGLADAVGCRPACEGDLDELGAAVAGVRHAVCTADLLQPLHLPGDVRCLHSQPGGQLAGAHRPGFGKLLQDHHGGAVQRYRGHGPDPVVAPGPGDQVADPGDRPRRPRRPAAPAGSGWLWGM